MARFTVHAAHDDRHHSHIIEGDSFEDAAMAFSQMWRPADDQDGSVRVRVVDRDSGEQHCFILDLADPEGRTDPAACN
jgi:hypothetical protein